MTDQQFTEEDVQRYGAEIAKAWAGGSQVLSAWLSEDISGTGFCTDLARAVLAALVEDGKLLPVPADVERVYGIKVRREDGSWTPTRITTGLEHANELIGGFYHNTETQLVSSLVYHAATPWEPVVTRPEGADQHG